MAKMPQDPQGAGLVVDMVVEDGAWRPFLGDDPKVGRVTRIGVLPRGMTSGRPAVVLVVVLEDGTSVLAQASWRSLSLAMVGLIARWGTP